MCTTELSCSSGIIPIGTALLHCVLNPTHLDAAATLVSEEADCSSTEASSESKEEERGVRLDDFAASLELIVVLIPAVLIALVRSAATVQKGTKTWLVPGLRVATIDVRDLDCVSLVVLLATISLGQRRCDG